MFGKRFPVLLLVGSKFEKLALLISAVVVTGVANGICGKRFRPKSTKDFPTNLVIKYDSNYKSAHIRFAYLYSYYLCSFDMVPSLDSNG